MKDMLSYRSYNSNPQQKVPYYIHIETNLLWGYVAQEKSTSHVQHNASLEKMEATTTTTIIIIIIIIIIIYYIIFLDITFHTYFILIFKLCKSQHL